MVKIATAQSRVQFTKKVYGDAIYNALHCWLFYLFWYHYVIVVSLVMQGQNLNVPVKEGLEGDLLSRNFHVFATFVVSFTSVNTRHVL